MFISRGKEDALVTKNMVVGESVYGEKRISVEVRIVYILYVYMYGKTCNLDVKIMYGGLSKGRIEIISCTFS